MKDTDPLPERRISAEEAYWFRHGAPTEERRRKLGIWAAAWVLLTFTIPFLIPAIRYFFA